MKNEDLAENWGEKSKVQKSFLKRSNHRMLIKTDTLLHFSKGYTTVG